MTRQEFKFLGTEILLVWRKLYLVIRSDITFYGPQGLTMKQMLLSKHNFFNGYERLFNQLLPKYIKFFLLNTLS